MSQENLFQLRRRRPLTGHDQAAVDHQGGKGPHAVVVLQGRDGEVLQVGGNGVGRQYVHHLLIKLLAAGAAQPQDLDFQAGGDGGGAFWLVEAGKAARQ